MGMINRAKASYKMRLNKFWIINASWTIRKALYLLSDYVDFYGKNDWQTVLDEAISKENREVKYGGHLPNIKSDFFPPHFNVSPL